MEAHTVALGRMACALRLLTVSYVTVMQSATVHACLALPVLGPAVFEEDTALLK